MSHTRIEPHSLQDRWPDTPGVLDHEELVALVAGLREGRVFTNRDLPGFTPYYMDRLSGPRPATRPPPPYPNEMASVWPLFQVALKVRGAPPESFTEKVGALWEWRDRAVKEVVLDGVTLPTFMTVRFVSLEQWNRAQELKSA